MTDKERARKWLMTATDTIHAEGLAAQFAEVRAEARRQALEEALGDERDACWCIPDATDFEPCGPCMTRARIRSLMEPEKT